jgi:aerobic carbon-monoxide dehydrogenase medium subunit
MTAQLAEDELVVAARVPTIGPGWGWSFQEITRRDGDFAVAAAAVLVRIADGVVVESRVAVGAVSDRPVRLADVEISLGGATVSEIGDRVGPIQALSPISDAAASASHRTHLCRVLVTRALAEASSRSLNSRPKSLSRTFDGLTNHTFRVNFVQ